VKNRMREFRTSGSVRDGDGNVPIYSALVATPLLFALALLHDARIETDAGNVGEDAAVDLTNINASDPAAEKSLNRLLEFARDAEVLGEMIEGLHRQHAEDGVHVDQRRGGRRDRSVAASAHDQPADRARLLGMRIEFGSACANGNARLPTLLRRHPCNERSRFSRAARSCLVVENAGQHLLHSALP